MKKTIILMLLAISLLVSCKEKEFRAELNFVYNLIQNPDKADSILVNSEFYDKNIYVGFKFKNLDKNYKIIEAYYTATQIKCVTVDNCKEIIIGNSEEKLRIEFVKIKGKYYIYRVLQYYMI